MPKIYTYLGYVISIWQSENGEPIHVHVSKGRATANATKIWILRNGDVAIAHNKSRIPEHELDLVCKFIKLNYINIVNFWSAYHGYTKFLK